LAGSGHFLFLSGYRKALRNVKLGKIINQGKQKQDVFMKHHSVGPRGRTICHRPTGYRRIRYIPCHEGNCRTTKGDKKGINVGYRNQPASPLADTVISAEWW
jgi:hypothetical protein